MNSCFITGLASFVIKVLLWYLDPTILATVRAFSLKAETTQYGFMDVAQLQVLHQLSFHKKCYASKQVAAVSRYYPGTGMNSLINT
jgi:hypothetical protein